MPEALLLIKPASSMCNMRCKYCFYSDVAENREIKSYGMMSLSTLEIIVKKALEYADNFCTFSFQGGEPTLAGIEFYKELIIFENKYNTKNVKIFNSIQTNGFIIDNEFAKFFKENNFLVGLSLDGNRELNDYLRLDSTGKGTFDRVIKTVKLFNEFKVDYNILCVVNNFTAKHSNEVYNFFKKNNFKYLQFIECLNGFDNQINNYSLTPERYTVFLKNTFDNYYNDFINGNYISIRMFDNYVSMLSTNRSESCSMNGFCSCNFIVEGDGSVFPCDFYMLDKYKLGNITENSFEQIKNSEIAIKFVEESKYIDTKCRECKWLKICRGGCRRLREPFIDGKPSLNKYCESYYNFFEYSYERLKIMARINYKSV